MPCVVALPGSKSMLTRVCHLQFRKLVRTIQNIALTLNRHYPARLHRLFLVGAPAIVHLPVRVSVWGMEHHRNCMLWSCDAVTVQPRSCTGHSCSVVLRRLLKGCQGLPEHEHERWYIAAVLYRHLS